MNVLPFVPRVDTRDRLCEAPQRRNLQTEHWPPVLAFPFPLPPAPVPQSCSLGYSPDKLLYQEALVWGSAWVEPSLRPLAAWSTLGLLFRFLLLLIQIQTSSIQSDLSQSPNPKEQASHINQPI